MKAGEGLHNKPDSQADLSSCRVRDKPSWETVLCKELSTRGHTELTSQWHKVRLAVPSIADCDDTWMTRGDNLQNVSLTALPAYQCAL